MANNNSDRRTASVTLRNRVQPDGLISDAPMRGTFTGNRGILHTKDKHIGDALWRHRAWICCTLNWQGRRRNVMTGRKWTELFFLDEATAMAAGHRPCAYCRRPAYTAFKNAWGKEIKAPEMDAILHKARAVAGARSLQRHKADISTLPPGTFILTDQFHLLTDDALLPYTVNGYAAPISRPNGQVTVLTSPPMIDVLRGGYIPNIHPSAQIPLFP